MRRGRLARKYLAVLVSLVAGVLAISGAIELRSSYVENKAALVALQREKAGNAAASIEGFVREIERQLVWTTQPSSLTGRAALEERRLDAIRLLRQAPAVTDVSHLDAAGREQVRVSRVDRDDIGSGTDYSTQPRFLEARRGRTWFGPVYFRKESEPYMTIALPQGGGGVTAAEVNLKFIWDVVSQIRIGKTGLAYAVDRTGALIAHPDISLVLQKTSLANLEQVRAALAPNPGGDDITLARDVRGRDVLTAHSRIPSLGWVVFVEQPVQEAFAPVRASAWRIVVLVVLGIAFSAVASVVLARRLARPIQALQESASRIGAGELDHRISIRTGDELEALADQFNEMTGRLRESYATLEQKVEDRTRELREALEQQTATAEILRVISSSPTDVQPVLDAVAESAARLCGATDALIHRVEDGQMLRVAHFGPVAVVAPSPVRPATPGTPSGRAILEARTIHVHDVLAHFARGEYPEARQLQEGSGFRTVLCTPLVRDGVAIGVIVIRRMEVRPFSDAQIALLQTFADQAVIAIENVRLFTELESRNAALTEALDRQTATAEILGVISSSPTDMAPVFETIVRNVVRLCHGWSSALYRYDGELVHNVALTDPSPEAREEYARTFPRRPTLETPIGRVVLSGDIMHIPDVLAEPSLSEVPKRIAQLRGYRGMLMVPMMREGSVVGVIAVSRVEPGLFSDSQVQLVKTFADQAVIAIENVRLFTELEARNAALTESLDQQTATAEILRVISSSPTDVQPVFEAILASATRLCGAEHGILNLYDGEAFTGVAFRGLSAEAEAVFRARGPKPGPMSGIGRMLGAKAPVQVADVTDDPAYRAGDPLRVRTAELLGARTAMWLPLLKGDIVIGAMAIYRREVRPFTDKQVELVTTFADQAVIAIENVRLFTELQARTGELTRSVTELEALGEVGRTISSTLDLDRVLETIVARANELAGTDGGAIYEFDAVTRAFNLRATDNFAEHFVAELRSTPLDFGEGAVGRAAAEQRPVQIADVADSSGYESRVRDLLLRSGYRSLLAVPLLSEGEVVGALVVNRRVPGEFPARVVELLRTFATQSALAIGNARLFREIEDKSRQLEAANRHKDEFLASMSHELRTPLNAVIGFSEVLLERMFGELNPKQEEYLNDILASGRHLLSLINDILDLAKIEAGRMELDLEDFDLAQAIDNALVLIRERATRKGLALDTKLDGGLGQVRGDQRKVKQVLLNLLSNAVKFTPEGGRVEVRGQRADGHVEIAVSDTGIGIAPEDQETVFEEFRQVGTDYTKKHEGTGLGLTLSRKFVELHGGRIWLKSQPGHGSTFTFTLPVQAWPTSAS